MAARLPSEFRPFVRECPALGLIGDTPLVRLELEGLSKPGVEVYAKVEYFNPGGSIKDRPVLWMLLSALRDGRWDENRAALDSSSGNAGIAYAMIGRALGRSVELVVPGNASAERKRRILAHGAGLRFTDPLEGYDEALRTAHRLGAEQPDRYFLCDQYSNDANWKAHYYTTAAEIIEQTGGEVTHFVAGVGTGGTITGVGRRLKEELPGVEVVQVEPDAFPGIEGLKPLGSPEDIIPAIYDPSVVDSRVQVSIEDAYRECQNLARAGFFAGQSSGAFVHGVKEVVERIDRGVVVTVFSDFGERYFSTDLWSVDEPPLPGRER